MNKAYWIAAYRSVSDEAAVAAYGKLAVPVILAHGGNIIARNAGDAVVAHEAGIQQRTVIVEFPSFDIARQAYDSEGYAAALQALGNGAERDFRIIEGVAPA